MSTDEATPKLFQPIRVGTLQLAHRVVLAPLTRFRANAAHVQSEIAVEYYTQRASTPGTLLISEGVFVTPRVGGYANVPGLWTDEQTAAWKRVRPQKAAHGAANADQTTFAGHRCCP